MSSETWVGLTLIWGIPPSSPAAKPHLPNSHQPITNWADSGTFKIQVNLTQSTRTWDLLYKTVTY